MVWRCSACFSSLPRDTRLRNEVINGLEALAEDSRHSPLPWRLAPCVCVHDHDLEHVAGEPSEAKFELVKVCWRRMAGRRRSFAILCESPWRCTVWLWDAAPTSKRDTCIEGFVEAEVPSCRWAREDTRPVVKVRLQFSGDAALGS